jgi:hypothetical protein
MGSFEIGRRKYLEAGVKRSDTRQRRPRALPVIEQRVIQIEEYGANTHASL